MSKPKGNDNDNVDEELNSNSNLEQPHPQPPKLAYHRDWSTVGRDEAVQCLRNICTVGDQNDVLSDSSISRYLKIQLQAAIVGVHGAVRTYGMEHGRLNLQFLHIPVQSRARQTITHWRDRLEDQYQAQQRQHRAGLSNVSRANTRVIRFNISSSNGSGSYHNNDNNINNSNGNKSSNSNSSSSNSSNSNSDSSAGSKNNSNNGNNNNNDEMKSIDGMDDFGSMLDFGMQNDITVDSMGNVNSGIASTTNKFSGNAK